MLSPAGHGRGTLGRADGKGHKVAVARWLTEQEFVDIDTSSVIAMTDIGIKANLP